MDQPLTLSLARILIVVSISAKSLVVKTMD